MTGFVFLLVVQTLFLGNHEQPKWKMSANDTACAKLSDGILNVTGNATESKKSNLSDTVLVLP